MSLRSFRGYPLQGGGVLNAMLTSGGGVLKTREEKVRNPNEGGA